MNSCAQELSSPQRIRVGLCSNYCLLDKYLCKVRRGKSECFSLMVLLARTNLKTQNRFYSGSSGKTRLADQGCLPEASGAVCVCGIGCGRGARPARPW